ncbi:MAG: HEAT repeat domain-containing protein, partial [Planctomycetota bacterium]|nr:HEAT repeat domain-containing protein [Planctomycetota bacterium]
MRVRVRRLLVAVVLGACCVSAHAADGMDTALAALQHTEPARRLQATNMLALAAPGPDRSRAVRALEQAVFDPEPVVRRGALNALVRLDARAAGGTVVRLISVEGDPTVLPAALLALGALHVEGQDDVLVRHAAHPIGAVRAAALMAAGDLGGPQMRRLVLNALQMAGEEDAQWFVRTSAILALARIGTAEDLAAIQHAFERGGGRAHWIARTAVAKALAALHPRPRTAL